MNLVLAFVALLAAGTAAAQDSQAAWDALARGGHVLLIRHASAPGLADPPGVRADDCKTQRNLDDAGRAQAKELGDMFRARGVKVGRVLSSPWCRCVDTATLMAVGKVETSMHLLSDRAGKNPERRAGLKEWIAGWRGPGNLVLVSHGWAIEALFGFIPASAETLVIKPSGASSSGGDLVGRISPPPAKQARI